MFKVLRNFIIGLLIGAVVFFLRFLIYFSTNLQRNFIRVISTPSFVKIKTHANWHDFLMIAGYICQSSPIANLHKLTNKASL